MNYESQNHLFDHNIYDLNSHVHTPGQVHSDNSYPVEGSKHMQLEGGAYTRLMLHCVNRWVQHNQIHDYYFKE